MLESFRNSFQALMFCLGFRSLIGVSGSWTARHLVVNLELDYRVEGRDYGMAED
jgi:hypothetical protein